MATEQDVRRIALGLPDVTEDGGTWRVHKKLFVWLRELRKSDLAALGDAAPTGPLIAARIADEGEKAALIQQNPDVYFTTPHFNGYPAILVRLDNIDVDELAEVITDAWLVQAPKRFAKAFLEQQA